MLPKILQQGEQANLPRSWGLRRSASDGRRRLMVGVCGGEAMNGMTKLSKGRLPRIMLSNRRSDLDTPPHLMPPSISPAHLVLQKVLPYGECPLGDVLLTEGEALQVLQPHVRLSTGQKLCLGGWRSRGVECCRGEAASQTSSTVQSHVFPCKPDSAPAPERRMRVSTAPLCTLQTGSSCVHALGPSYSAPAPSRPTCSVFRQERTSHSAISASVRSVLFSHRRPSHAQRYASRWASLSVCRAGGKDGRAGEKGVPPVAPHPVHLLHRASSTRMHT